LNRDITKARDAEKGALSLKNFGKRDSRRIFSKRRRFLREAVRTERALSILQHGFAEFSRMESIFSLAARRTSPTEVTPKFEAAPVS
jgi:hypothetical protein